MRKNKKLTLSLLLLAFVNQLFASWGGSGTQQNPYLLSTAADLQLLSKNVNAGQSYQGVYFRLRNNVDMSSVSQWQPIGTIEHPFRGTFDGAGFAVGRLTVYCSSENVALFGVANQAVIMNLGVVNSSIRAQENVAALVAYLLGGVLQNCYNNQANIEGELNVGGLVGYAYDATIESCYNDGKIEGQTNVGGLVGLAFCKTKLYNSYNIGTVEGRIRVGGLVGKIDGYRHKAEVKACYYQVNLSQIPPFGALSAAVTSNCYYDPNGDLSQQLFATKFSQQQLQSPTCLDSLNTFSQAWISDKQTLNNGFPILKNIHYQGVFTNNVKNIAQKEALLTAFVSTDEQVKEKGFFCENIVQKKEQKQVVKNAEFSLYKKDLEPFTLYKVTAYVLLESGLVLRGKTVVFRTLAEPHTCGPSCGHHH